MLTTNQEIHREYLLSPMWLAKRQMALDFYGPKCRRCGSFGTDVHHKTYKRTGGNELMSDLEVLCRSCHDAHHRAERGTRPRSRRKSKWIDRQAVFGYLTEHQKQILCNRHRMSRNDLYVHLHDAYDSVVLDQAVKMLGFAGAYGQKPKNPNKPNRFRNRKRNHYLGRKRVAEVKAYFDSQKVKL